MQIQIRRGEQQANSKLTAANIVEIRQAAGRGEMHKEIARRFGVSPNHISLIVRRARWRHIK